MLGWIQAAMQQNTIVNFIMDVLKLKPLRLQLENMCDPLRRQIWNPIFQSQLFLLLVMLLFFISDWFTWIYLYLITIQIVYEVYRPSSTMYSV